jgi:hypothetical protein
MVCPECGEEITSKKRRCMVCAHDWKAADLRYDGLLFDEPRRTAVRSLVRAGVPEKVTMLISGHRTRNTFERYNIANDRDVRDMALRFDSARDREQEAAIRATATPSRAAAMFGQRMDRVETEIEGSHLAVAHAATLAN